MSIASFLYRIVTGKPAPVIESPAAPLPVKAEHEPRMKDVFKSPTHLSEWVGAYVLANRVLEQDYELLPDADARKDLDITPEQRDRCLREYSVVRLAGVSLCIRQYYPYTFWLAFSDAATAILWHQLNGEEKGILQSELRNAIESYVLAGEVADTDQCARLYMTRVYDDNPNYMRMKFAGIGDIGPSIMLDTYEVFRDAYCNTTQGMSYATFKQLSAAVEQAP